MNSDSISIRPMTEADLAFGVLLDELAGWNQLPDDWTCLLQTQPDGCFVAEMGERPVATITTTCYGTTLAWIGMMLVHPDHRRRGIATRLLRHAIAWLRNQGVRCIKLDATPAGAEVYSKLGFQTEWNFHRWVRPGSSDVQTLFRATNDWTLPHVDAVAFGEDRSHFLHRLSGMSAVVSSETGFGMIRSGRLADYLGPVTAESSGEADRVITQLMAKSDRTLFWDVPGPNVAATQMARTRDFVPVRNLTRMWIGTMQVTGVVHNQFALASPATG